MQTTPSTDAAFLIVKAVPKPARSAGRCRRVGRGGAKPWLLGGMVLVLGWAEAVRAAPGEFTTGFDRSSPGGDSQAPAVPRSHLPEIFIIKNGVLNVSVNTLDGRFSVMHRRADQFWNQRAVAQEVIVLDGQTMTDRIELKLRHAASGLDFTATWQLVSDQPEFTVALAGAGPMPPALPYPHPFASAPGDYLIVPLNEGISYPAEDKTIEPMRLVAYGGQGLSMSFWGVTDGAKGHLAVIETPDDAAIRIGRVEGRLAVAPEWEAQKGQFGYTRRLRYVFFEQGGHGAICKRYRTYAWQRGLLRTLTQKRAGNPNVDLLVGAANVWCWDEQPVALAQQMKAAGLDRLLWSNRQSPDAARRLNALGILAMPDELKPVTGSETGHEAAAPLVHYFEGMMSLAPYRVPEPSRDAPRIRTEVPAPVARFQLGHRYRLPLWELVYHDCVVAHWHWSDGNNKLPALWDKRDLFNLLYGTPPLFLLDRALWETNQARFVQSYHTVCPVARAAGYSEMLTHRFLTPERDVQQTLFANGMIVTVNFGQAPYQFTTPLAIPPLGFHVIGLPGREEQRPGPSR